MQGTTTDTMDHVQVFEYYDGYEHLWSMEPEEDRERVRYIILGHLPNNLVAICYVGELHHLATLHETTHHCAWAVENISRDLARSIVRDAYKSDRVGVDRYRDRHREVLENATALDAANPVAPGNKSSVYDSRWNVSFCYDNITGYAKPLADQLQKRISMLECASDFISCF